MKINKKSLIISSFIVTVLAISFFLSDTFKKADEPLSLEKVEIKEDLSNKMPENIEKSEENKNDKKQVEEVKNNQSQKDNTTNTNKPPISDNKVSEDKNDKYQTDKVPQGKPKPVEPQESEVVDVKLKAKLSVSVLTVFNNMDKFNPEKIELVPKDGFILALNTVEFNDGESVFDILEREIKNKKIHMEFSFFPIYNSVYIEGINNIYEFDCGSLSGWMYKVNGWFPNYGASRYKVSENDIIEWVYTCDLGLDVGGNNVLQ